MSVWRASIDHNTYPGFCRHICREYGLVQKTSRANSDECIGSAEHYYKNTRKRISDRCCEDYAGLLKHESLRDFYDAAWLIKRYTQDKKLESKNSTERNMTVSLFKSVAGGADEIVVQTNAQTLESFVNSFSEALHDAIQDGGIASRPMVVSALKNAFPIAFALSGYKAEKVSEARLLTCGFASPDASELIAQS